MVAGLPGAVRRAIMKSDVGNMESPELISYMYRAYNLGKFDPNPEIERREWDDQGFTYESSLSEFCVDDIITIINDLIDEKL